MQFNVPTVEEFAGLPLKAWRERVCAYLLGTRLIAGKGIKLRPSTGGTVIEASGVGIYYAKGPSGGISARSTGTATLYTDFEAGTLGTATATVRNVQPDAVPSGGVLLTVERGTNNVLTWSCAAAPTTAMST